MSGLESIVMHNYGVRLVIALTPGEVLNANQRTHWAAKARKVAAIRARAVVAWRQAGSPQLDRAHLTVHLGYPDARNRDAHNLIPTIKAAIDGAVHPAVGVRGILADDTDRELTGPDLRPAGITRGLYTFCLEWVAL